MRHRNKTVILGRKKGPREALLRNLATSVILYEHVTTTLAKAKSVRPLVGRLVTVGKHPTLNARRTLHARLFDPQAVKKMLEVIGPRFSVRNGGYTRIVKIGPRVGDNAPRAIIEFVE